MMLSRGWNLGVVVGGVLGLSCVAFALNAPHTLHRAKPQSHLSSSHRTGARHVRAKAKTTGTRKAAVVTSGSKARLRKTVVHRHRYYERFTASSFASSDIFTGDKVGGEDPVVRQAAIDALDGMNGTAVQLAGFRMNMTQALAKSNNLYFEELGRELGFQRVRHYATQFGLGELAGYNIPGEQLGTYPDQAIPQSQGGVGRMCSFGQGVSLTPLQLGAFVAAIANGGTLYYLQHPTTPEEAAHMVPKVKRTLDIARYVPEMQDGMAGAVQYGTARRLRASFTQLPVFGKTGTCSDNGTRFGWFVSYSETPQGNLVTVFFLEGGRPTFGPRAAELTGAFYKNLWDHEYFAQKNTLATTTTAVETGTTGAGATGVAASQ
jgi:penicillin-binding protein 2